MDEVVSGYVSRFRSLGLLGSPCSPAEVTALERHLGLSLPPSYQAYLLVDGHSPPPGLVGSDCTLHYLYQLHEWAEDLLQQCGRPFELPDRAVVFLMHQGYVFQYFQAGGGNDDPSVFCFLEGDPGPVQVAERFSDWVADVATC